MTHFDDAGLSLARGGQFPSPSRLFSFSDPSPGRRRVISERLTLELGEAARSVVTITRTGVFYDPRYGEFSISPALLDEMVRNFIARTYGQDIHVDVSHHSENGSAGKFVRLFIDGDRLRGEVEWTPYGRKAITERGYQYLSADIDINFHDNESRLAHGAVLRGAGLTIRPVIKRLDPVQLSEPASLHWTLAAQFTQEAKTIMNTHLKTLLTRLSELKLAEPLIKQLSEAFTTAAKTLGENDAALTALVEQFAATAKTLAEQLGEKPAVIQLTVQPSAVLSATTDLKMLSEDDVKRILAEQQTAQAETTRMLAETQATLREKFRTLLNDAPGLKTLSEPQRTVLLSAESVIEPGMTEAQIKMLADQQIQVGNQWVVSQKLASMGWAGPRPAGSMHIELNEHSALKLQERIDQHLKSSASYGIGRLKLTEESKLKPVVQKILAEFDRLNAEALHREAQLFLADGGPTTVSSMTVPAGFQRAVIKEALSDLIILDLVQMLAKPDAQMTTSIPYELRKPGSLANDGIVYEGQGIPRASVEVRMDAAYVAKMALSLLISNEVMFFSRTALIDWDAFGSNVESNARIMRELVARRIANEMQRSADAYGATARTAENIASQLTGSNSLIKTAQWPVVRPRQVRDLQGNSIGSAENPIALVVNNAAITEYDGSGTQANGLYYRLENLNLGMIRLVNQAGVYQTPTASSTCTIGYSSANNVSRFDLKLPANVGIKDHLDGAIEAIGARKALLNADRYILPDYLLMSPVLNELLTNARQFTSEGQRAGSGLSGSGDLIAVKALPTYGTNAPNIDLGDERILLGQRGTLTYTVVKPFMTGTPFEAVNSAGLPTGQKIAYGEEYNSIHIPVPIRDRMTSVIVYNSDARTAAT